MSNTCDDCGITMNVIPDRYDLCISCDPESHGLPVKWRDGE